MNTVKFHYLNVPLPPHFQVARQSDTELVIEGTPPDNEYEKQRFVRVTFEAEAVTASAHWHGSQGTHYVGLFARLSEKRVCERWMGPGAPKQWRPSGMGGRRLTSDMIQRLLIDSQQPWGWG